MLVEARQELDAAGAVVQAMQPAPQARHRVPRAVPPVVDEGEDEVTERRFRSDAAFSGAPQRQAGQPAIAGVDREQRDRGLDGGEAERTRPPTRYALET